MDRLIYDRTIEDVDYARENQDSENYLKGAYNYTDFNRIEEWNQYLSNELIKHSYPIDYIPHENQCNILNHGSLANNTLNWEMHSSYDYESSAECTTIKCKTTAEGTYPCYQYFSSISGSTSNTKQVIYACAKVRSRTSNVSYPRVYITGYANGSSSISYYNMTSIDGKTGTSLNDNQWHTMSIYLTTQNGNNYYEYIRIAFGVNGSTIGDEIDVKDIILINLTTLFERGLEPNKSWCDSFLSGKWNMSEYPTYYEMNRIRNNLVSLVNGFTSMTPIHSASVLNSFNYDDANNWERILWEISTMLISMENYQVYSGVANAGQQRFWQNRFRVLHPLGQTTWEQLQYEHWNDIPANTTWQGLIGG